MHRVANVFISLGAVVGVIGCIGLAVGWRPSDLPPALLNLAAYKLVFIAAGGLLTAGAVLGRAAVRSGARAGAPSAAARPPAELSLGAPGSGPAASESRGEPEHRER